MSQQTLNRTIQQLKLKTGLRANIEKTATANLGVQGEPAYTTDTKQLFIRDATSFVPVQTLDMAVVSDGDVVTNNGEIVFNY